MSKKRWIAAAAIMSMVLTVPIGCQGTSAGSENPSAGSKDSSQEDLVVPKNQESTVPAQTAKGGNIAEQVQAPDAFELQFSDESGKIEVEVKARVVVPEAGWVPSENRYQPDIYPGGLRCGQQGASAGRKALGQGG